MAGLSAELIQQGRQGGGSPLSALIGGIVAAKNRRREEDKARQVEEEGLERELKKINEQETQKRITTLLKAKQEGRTKVFEEKEKTKRELLKLPTARRKESREEREQRRKEIETAAKLTPGKAGFLGIGARDPSLEEIETTREEIFGRRIGRNGKGASQEKAIKFLEDNNAPVTEANINAVIKKFKF